MSVHEEEDFEEHKSALEIGENRHKASTMAKRNLNDVLLHQADNQLNDSRLLSAQFLGSNSN